MTFEQRVKGIMAPIVRNIEDQFLDDGTVAADVAAILDKLADLGKKLDQIKADVKQNEPNAERDDPIEQRKKKERRKRLLEEVQDRVDDLIHTYFGDNLPQPIRNFIYYLTDWLTDTLFDLLKLYAPWADLIPGEVIPELPENLPPLPALPYQSLNRGISYTQPFSASVVPFIPEDAKQDAMQLDLLRKLSELSTALEACCASTGSSLTYIMRQLDHIESGGVSMATIVAEMRRRCP